MFPEETRCSHILAVDDTLDNLLLFEVLLESEGFNVSLASSGQAALHQIEVAPPGLILLDVMMPDMDGYEVTCRIRQSPHLPDIPILLVTAHEHSNVMKAIRAGANDYIRKPFDTDELIARIRSLMQPQNSSNEWSQGYSQPLQSERAALQSSFVP